MRIRLNFLLILLAFLADVGAATVGFAPVRNFSRQTYGAAPQNWSATQDNAGRLFFGNGEGLLKFDGLRWSLFHLPNYTTVRAVLADGNTGRVYVGGTGEFGFFKTDPQTGKMSFVSMVPKSQGNAGGFSEIWNIHEMERGVMAFQGDYKIFICGDNNTVVVNSREKLTSSACIEGRLYAGSQSGYLYCLEDNALRMVGKVGSGSRIVAILPFSGASLMAVTASDGLFILKDGKFVKPHGWDLDSFLIDNQVFCAASNGNSFAFGTVNDGAVVKNIRTGEENYINRHTGLQNNTVLGLLFDFSDNLWLCLDNGISYAMVDSPVFNLLGDSNTDAGAGYTSMLKGNVLLLGTNRGLFSTPYPFPGRVSPPQLTRMLNGQIWSIDSIGKDVFVSTDNGLYALREKGSPVKIDGLAAGSWSVVPLKSHPGKALVSAYDGFYLLSHIGGGWKSEGKVEGFEDAGGKFMEETDGSIWIAHWMKGVYRLRLAPDLKSFSSVRLFTSKDGLPNERDNSLATYNGQLRIATASGEFFMPDGKGGIVRDEELTGLVPLKMPAHFYSLPSGTSFAFSPKLVWKITRESPGTVSIDSVSLHPVAGSLIPGFEHVGMLDRDNMLVAHQDGFFSVKLDGKPSQKWKNKVFVESLVAGDSILFSGVREGSAPGLRIPYSLNSLTFYFAAPEYRYENAVLYSCMLEDYDVGWSVPSEVASKEYTKLAEGAYTLRVRALNTVTGEESESAFRFTVLPPWYRSTPAKLIYALLVVLLIFLGYRLFIFLSGRNAERVQRQKDAEMDRMKREAEKEALQKDYEIASLKSSRLELDIKHKSSELSNTAMNVIRKNEILNNISGLLTRLQQKAVEEDKSSPTLKKEFDKIQKLIRENISHDDDWKKFNQNFDIVYADFTKNLMELYPTLTNSERRLCCYLKMGLSSKDIAPILSISPKSVEMNRYRLRQKMGLSRDVNLVEYLQNI